MSTVHHCRKQLLTEHEDLELGRCIQERLGVSCVRAYEANRLFKQNYDFNTQSNEERLKMFREIAAGSIATYHPNKQPEQQYQIHNAFKNARIGELITETATLEQELLKTKRELNEHIVDNRFVIIIAKIWTIRDNGSAYAVAYNPDSL